MKIEITVVWCIIPFLNATLSTVLYLESLVVERFATKFHKSRDALSGSVYQTLEIKSAARGSTTAEKYKTLRDDGVAWLRRNRMETKT